MKGGGKNRRDSSSKGGKNSSKPKRVTIAERSSSTTHFDDIMLLDHSGNGATEAEKTVTRVSISKFFSCRMQYLDGPAGWEPEPKAHWRDGNRRKYIEDQMGTLWNFKPLEVNDETRWKTRTMLDDDELDSSAERVRKAMAILNKLSWTNIDKLTTQYLTSLQDGVTEDKLNKDIVRDSMSLIVEKAMEEPHFAELYARFSAKLSAVHKGFKKSMLSICREQFELTGNEPVLPEEPAEREFVLIRERKRSIGLMQFIGELYKQSLIKGGIMIGCLMRLCVPTDEDMVECFAKLMTTVGERLHDHENDPVMHELWDNVFSMAGKSSKKNGPKAPSVRTRFLLCDLIELKENGWVKRREEEKATTLAQIHKSVAHEEAVSRRGGQTPSQPIGRSRSSGGLSKQTPTPNPSLQQADDSDGFTAVEKSKKVSMKRTGSGLQVSSLQLAAAGGSTSQPQKPKPAVVEKVSPPPSVVEYPNPVLCGVKMQSILKEYFIGGDTDDAVLSVKEIVGASHNGDVARGTSVLESGILFVLERKKEDVEKFLLVATRCIQEDDIPRESVVKSLNEPLEFLRDVEIDAPRAGDLLSMIIAEWIDSSFLTLDVLSTAPEFFLTDGRPASFAAQILAQFNQPISDSDVAVVEKLLTDEEKASAPSSREWLEQAIQGYK